MYLRLYPDGVKPKLHYLNHLPRCWERFRRILSCWTPERKHRGSKRIGSFSLKNLALTYTPRLLRVQLASLRDDCTFRPYRTQLPLRLLRLWVAQKLARLGLPEAKLLLLVL